MFDSKKISIPENPSFKYRAISNTEHMPERIKKLYCKFINIEIERY